MRILLLIRSLNFPFIKPYWQHRQVVQLTLINGEGAEHDIVFPDQDSKSPRVTGRERFEMPEIPASNSAGKSDA